MSKQPVEGEKRVFMTGNEVVAWAALAAGAELMYGYPITPQNEIMHYWTRLAPRFNRGFLQTEDELSAGFATLGGVLAGKLVFSATSGPGNVLFQEPMSMAEMMRLPAVVIVQQRGGPSTATVIYSQQEVVLTAHGGNGEGLRVVYSTGSHQELYDYTIKSFNTAWKYRFPTFVLGDGYQAKMREPLTLYNPQARDIKMVLPEAFIGKEGIPGVDRPPAHLRNCFSVEEELYEALMPSFSDYENMSSAVIEYQEGFLDEAQILVISHGIVNRAVKAAVEDLREKNYKVGFFRPITLRPFPENRLRELAQGIKRLLVVESAQGQLASLVKQSLWGVEIHGLEQISKPGMGITREEVMEKIKNMQTPAAV